MSKSNGSNGSNSSNGSAIALSPAERAALMGARQAEDGIVKAAQLLGKRAVTKAVRGHLSAVLGIVAGRIDAHPALTRTVEDVEADGDALLLSMTDDGPTDGATSDRS